MLQYLDGDLVTVFDSQDLLFALQTSRVLKLQVFMNNLCNQGRIKPQLSSEELKKQLREIRDAVTWLLDTIEVTNEGNNINIPNTIGDNNKCYIITTIIILFNYIYI